NDQTGNIKFGIEFKGSMEVRVFGFTLAGVGVGVSFTAEGQGGRIDVVASVTVTITIIFSFDITVSIPLGTIELPRPIHLGGDKGTDPNVGQITWNGGELYLNMGSRASARGVGNGQINEVFYVEHLGGDASGETVKVIGMGREQTFSNVTKIVVPDAGEGADQIIVRKGVLVPVELQ